MVYSRYISRNGKKYGPYYYETRRVGARTITRYVSTPLRPTSLWFVGLLALVFTALTFAGLYLFVSPTGHVTLNIASNTAAGQLINGTLILTLEPNEFLPADTQIVLSLEDQENILLLSDLFVVSSGEGDYRVSGAELSGTGQGYGAGAETRYPEVSFELLISKGESGSVGGGNTGKTEEKKEEFDKGEKKEESWEESGGLKGDKGEETSKQDNEKKSEEQVGNAKEEEKNEDANKEAEKSEEVKKEETVESESKAEEPVEAVSEDVAPVVESGEQIITGAVVAGNEESFSGSVKKGENFTHTLKAGESVALKTGSVKIGGQSYDDSIVQIASSDGKITVTTAYEITENSSESLELKIDLSRFNIAAEKGTLNVRVVARGSEIVRVSEEIEVEEQESEENETEEQAEIISNMTNVTLDDSSNETLGNLTGVNVTLNETNVTTNVTVLGNETIGNATVKTSRAKIRVGERVKWVKNVSLEKAENVTVELPKEAENVSVKKIEESGREEEAKAEVRGITGNVIHGEVTAEIELAKEGGFMRFVRGLFGGATGRVIAKDNASAGINESATTGEMIVVTLSDNATSYTIEYYTEAPIAYEQNISSGKQVVISGPDGLNYTDVISFTTIEERFVVGQESAIQIYWLENKSFIY